MSKLRIIKDFQKLSQELQEQVKLVYPEGFSQHLIEFQNAKKEIVKALPFETDDKIYLLKMSVRVANQIIEDDDDYDDDGNLLDSVKEKYVGDYAELDYLADNENYNAEEDDDDDDPDVIKKGRGGDDDDD